MRGDDPIRWLVERAFRTEFPACAGMIRFDLLGQRLRHRVPRMRGDDPKHPKR